MGRVIALFRKDLVLGIKDVFVLLELAFSVIVLLLLLFVVPEDTRSEASVYVHDETGLVRGFAERLAAADARAAERSGDTFVASREELIAGMVDDRAALGLSIAPAGEGRFAVTLHAQPYTTEAVAEYVDAEMDDLLSLLVGAYPADVAGSVRIEALAAGLRDELPFNKRLLPLVIMMMVGIMGLFIMVSMVGQERSEETIRAYKVSPSGLGAFLLSKHLLLIVLGTCTFSIIYLPLMGTAGYPSALLVTLLTVVMGSSLGVILGAFFDSPMASILWVLLLMMILGLPAVSLFAPVFSPWWLRLIPSYHTLFALDAAMFPDGNGAVIRQGAVALAALDLVLLPLSGAVFSLRLRKEA